VATVEAKSASNSAVFFSHNTTNQPTVLSATAYQPNEQALHAPKPEDHYHCGCPVGSFETMSPASVSLVTKIEANCGQIHRPPITKLVEKSATPNSHKKCTKRHVTLSTAT
jgi:hypothetical protein